MFVISLVCGELVNLLWLKNINKEGMAMLGMKYDRNVWKKDFGGENPGGWQETVEEWFSA